MISGEERVKEAEQRKLSEEDKEILRSGFETLTVREDWPPKNLPKVLVCCPTYDGKGKDFAAYMELITSLDFDKSNAMLYDDVNKSTTLKERMNKRMKITDKFMSAEMIPVWSVLGMLFIGFILSLIVSLFTKKANPTLEV